MIGAWFGIGVGFVILVVGAIALAKSGTAERYDRKAWLWGGIAALVGGILIAGGSGFWLYGTEGGLRAQRTWMSETEGGLTRTVQVYDMEGDLIQSYEGKFDVEITDGKVIFDVLRSDGKPKRVQILHSTGTVLIEEQ